MKTGPERLLGLVAIFASLTTEERKSIAAKLKQKSYDPGETLVEPGTVLHSLYIVGSGVLSFTREESEGEIELMRLGPGDHFGEIGHADRSAGFGKDQRADPLHGLRAGER